MITNSITILKLIFTWFFFSWNRFSSNLFKRRATGMYVLSSPLSRNACPAKPSGTSLYVLVLLNLCLAVQSSCWPQWVPRNASRVYAQAKGAGDREAPICAALVPRLVSSQKSGLSLGRDVDKITGQNFAFISKSNRNTVLTMYYLWKACEVTETVP